MRVLFCSLASPGYLNPAIGIALELRKRGHEVAFVTNPEFHERLAMIGLERIRGPEEDQLFRVNRWFIPGEIAMQLKHILFAVKLFKPDILVGQHFSLAALLLNHLLRIPTSIVGLCNFLWPVELALPEHPSSQEVERLYRHRETLRIYNDARALLKIPPYRDDDTNVFLGDMYLLRTVPEFLHESDKLPPKVHLVGHCLWEEYDIDRELEAWLEMVQSQNKPILYVQQGRFFQRPGFWRTLIEQTASDVFIAASTSRLDEAIGNLPPTVFARPYVPQQRVLRCAQAMIASGNTTAVLGAITAGVPSIIIPGGGEQPDLAAQCRRAGVSKVIIPEEASGEAICIALREILEDKNFKCSAEKLAAAFDRVNGFKEAANILETLPDQRVEANPTRKFQERGASA